MILIMKIMIYDSNGNNNNDENNNRNRVIIGF